MKTLKNAGRILVLILGVGLPLVVFYATESAVRDLSREAPKTSSGTIIGIVQNTKHLRVPGATLTATQLHGTNKRATTSGSSGIYALIDLPPGTWLITSRADGYTNTSVTSIDVAPGKTTRSDIVMAPSTTASRQPNSSTPESDRSLLMSRHVQKQSEDQKRNARQS